MFGLPYKKAFWLSFAIVAWISAVTSLVNAQPVYSRPAQPTPTPFKEVTIKTNGGTVSPTPFIQNTGIETPADGVESKGGILVMDLNGKVIRENNSMNAFNPASNVKVSTAYAVLKTFGPNYRFGTSVWSDGIIDSNTGTLTGNVYVSGKDPSFQYENAIEIAEALNKIGIRQINGDLIVSDRFIMGFNSSTQRSAESLFSTLSGSKRSSAAVRAWQSFLVAGGKLNQVQTNPSVEFSGGLYVDAIPSNAKLLFTHNSAPLKEIVKITLNYSNNFLAERLGDAVGGPFAVAGIIIRDTKVPANEFYLQTSSGLGINRVTPHAQMEVLKTLRAFLAQYKMNFGDIMCISQSEPGTLERRSGLYRGSVVAKTGTLGQTDGGVSSLSGEMKTRNGTLLFVIFNQKGGVNGYRRYQETLITSIQNQFGGAVPFGYPIISLPTRMANTQTVFANSNANNNTNNGTTRVRVLQ
jgi:D-alanyl-D-alanine carboxypeptidase/D-alanyl-D-alanine-endopeptidase (penicillin-binding protein 4)